MTHEKIEEKNSNFAMERAVTLMNKNNFNELGPFILLIVNFGEL
jgi:hypothetical protein